MFNMLEDDGLPLTEDLVRKNMGSDTYVSGVGRNELGDIEVGINPSDSRLTRGWEINSINDNVERSKRN